MNTLKLSAIMMVCLLVANIVLFVMRKISITLFWIIIVVCAIIAFWVLPRINKTTSP